MLAKANCLFKTTVRKEAAKHAETLGRLATHLNGARECRMDHRLSSGSMDSCGVCAVIAIGTSVVRAAGGAHP